MKSTFLLFPHQLFHDISLLAQADEVYLIEEHLFFNQYPFHKQKLLLHRASMRYYETYLASHPLEVKYIEATDPQNDIRVLVEFLAEQGVTQVYIYDVCDDWLEKRLTKACGQHQLNLREFPSPLFINTKSDLATYFADKKKYFQTDFYIQQRKKWNILLDAAGKPLGGKWSFDTENRHKYPKNKTAPPVQFPGINPYRNEAIEYVETHYANNYGKITAGQFYPSTHQEAEDWLQQFFEYRFFEFGAYEDAIVEQENILHHSLLTPMLNIGLLLPMQVIQAALSFAKENDVPVNSLEGFIRQILGWREFIRGVYVYKGTQARTQNFWNFDRKIPESFYAATTGIVPLDSMIKKVMATAYCHHIERLMILGNFMLLSKFDPDEVYRWFMELFIDAYDWVMVPNVYGMSQFADGGLMATKPYISGSNYVLKMSNYKAGEWCTVWDALFWNFLDKNRDFFSSNPRMGMLIKTFDKMDVEKKLKIAQISQEHT